MRSVDTMFQPADRVQVVGNRGLRAGGDCVVYWMTAARRARSNFALDRALRWCRALELPLVVFEPLRVDYLHASDRLHTFVLQGMADNQRAFADAGVRYLPFVERCAGQGKGLLAAVAQRAAVVVTDDYPTFFLPRMVQAAARSLDVRLEAVDSSGLMPMRAADREFTRAYSFRRHIQQTLPGHLLTMPDPEPLRRYRGGLAPVTEAAAAWPGIATADELRSPKALVGGLPIDHEVAAVATRGGPDAGREALADFVENRLEDYGRARNHPDDDGSSGLSPWLHFGHVSAHEVLLAVADHANWSPDQLAEPMGGARSGWWGMSESAEAFLEELVTWRELSLNLCVQRPDHAELSSLPNWARITIAEHAADERPYLYTLEQLENAETSDALWNAAQLQLRHEGRMHNYLRMLWGKLIYAWSPDAETALATMIHLNDRWALDGRDPNSYSGIGWVLGRFDRAWGPERPVFGKLRYMTSDSARRKLRLRRYLDRYSKQTTLATA